MKFKIRTTVSEVPEYSPYTYYPSGCCTGGTATGRKTYATSYQLLDSEDKSLGTFYSKEAAKEAAKFIAKKNTNVEEFSI
jgi:hypothetical protein